jgi:hypothetical protein
MSEALSKAFVAAHLAACRAPEETPPALADELLGIEFEVPRTHVRDPWSPRVVVDGL